MVNAQNTAVALSITQTSAAAFLPSTPTTTSTPAPNTPTASPTPLLAVPSDTLVPTENPRNATVSALLTQDVQATISVETSRDTQITDKLSVGEFSFVYPPLMYTGTSESAVLTIFIPKQLLDIDIEDFLRIDITPVVSPTIGKTEQDRGNLFVDRLMRAELDSSALQIKNENPSIQDIKEPSVQTYWVWSVTAPMEEGLYNLNLYIYLFEESDVPSLYRTYQIQVLQPTSTRTPRSTLAPSPTIAPFSTITLVPTFTLTPTPTQGVGLWSGDQNKNLPVILIAAVLVIGSIIGGIIIFVVKPRRRTE